MIITEDGSQEERMPKEQRDGVVEKSTQTEEQDNDFELESENSDPLAMMCADRQTFNRRLSDKRCRK